jgi:hypothetical protein
MATAIDCNGSIVGSSLTMAEDGSSSLETHRQRATTAVFVNSAVDEVSIDGIGG